MTDRKNPGPTLERDLLRFFHGKQCVITADDGADWHHLDENNANTEFVNLIPLKHELNVILGGLDRRKVTEVWSARLELKPDYLIYTAMTHYYKWRVWLAYGCARMAVFIGKKYAKSPSIDLASYAQRCLWYSRHRSEQRLFEDVLRRDLLPIVDANALGTINVVSVVHECASLLSEFGKPDLAEQALDRLDTAAPGWRLHMAQYQPRLSGILRREALVNFGRAGNADITAGLLRDSADAAGQDLAGRVGAANATAWTHFVRGEHAKAAESLDPFLDGCLDQMVNGPSSVRPIAIPLAMAAELVLLQIAIRKALKKSPTDLTGERLGDALRGLPGAGGFTVPLVSPALSTDLILNEVLQDFASRDLGDWTRPPLRASVIDAIKDVLARVHA